MRKLVLLSVVLLGLTAVSVAQETAPEFDIFGGYSYLNTEDLAPGFDVSGHGWEAAGTYYTNNWFGLTADLSGHYTTAFGVDVSDYNYLFGPTVAYRQPKFTPFGHLLLGGSRVSVDLGLLGPLGASATDNAFALALGGGADWHLNDRWSVRPVQLDYLMTHFGGNTQNNLRYSAGLVIRFGSR
jgi:opacity protein-like surface antigen